MKKILFYGLLVVSGLTACSSTRPVSDSNAIEWHVVEPKTNDLIGRWVFPDQGCTEYFDYRANGSFTSTSFHEKVEGRYSVERIRGSNATMKIRRVVRYDNRQADCQGSRLDATGLRTIHYLVFDASKKRLRVCEDAAANRCFGPLLRY